MYVLGDEVERMRERVTDFIWSRRAGGSDRLPYEDDAATGRSLCGARSGEELLSGAIGEEDAARLVRAGAVDKGERRVRVGGMVLYLPKEKRRDKLPRACRTFNQQRNSKRATARQIFLTLTRGATERKQSYLRVPNAPATPVTTGASYCGFDLYFVHVLSMTYYISRGAHGGQC